MTQHEKYELVESFITKRVKEFLINDVHILESFSKTYSLNLYISRNHINVYIHKKHIGSSIISVEYARYGKDDTIKINVSELLNSNELYILHKLTNNLVMKFIFNKGMQLNKSFCTLNKIKYED